jgi:PleD family two-component response regulator
MRIYFADDAEDARDIMAATLASDGYVEAYCASSGTELLAWLGIDPVQPSGPHADLILLDIKMPGIDGIETCARIRADPRHQHTPILMVSSLHDEDTLQHAFMAGANDYIYKPFNRIELLARMRAALRFKGELDRRMERERELMATQQVRGIRPRDEKSRLDPSTSLLPREIVEHYVFLARPPLANELSALALQVDRLREFRTGHGAVAKHDLLSQIAAMLAHLPARLGDLLSHFDIGLFVAVLHGADQAALARMAQEARRAVRDLAVQHGGGIVTVSIGVALNREPRALLSAAVAAAERAASEGGDRILFA